MPPHAVLRFWAWAGATALLAGLVPVAAVLGFSTADSPVTQVAVACALPVLVGLTFRSATAALAAVRGPEPCRRRTSA
jgi:hypothetical protein